MVWQAPVPSAPASPDVLAAEEQEFVAKVNAERTGRGLNALAVDPLLVRTARAHSREMCARDYFDHHSPTPGLTTPMDRYLKGLHDGGGSTPESLLIGENIYYCSVFNDIYNVDYGHRALMNSPGHRATSGEAVHQDRPRRLPQRAWRVLGDGDVQPRFGIAAPTARKPRPLGSEAGAFSFAQPAPSHPPPPTGW